MASQGTAVTLDTAEATASQEHLEFLDSRDTAVFQVLAERMASQDFLEYQGTAVIAAHLDFQEVG